MYKHNAIRYFFVVLSISSPSLLYAAELPTNDKKNGLEHTYYEAFDNQSEEESIYSSLGINEICTVWGIMPTSMHSIKSLELEKHDLTSRGSFRQSQSSMHSANFKPSQSFFAHWTSCKSRFLSTEYKNSGS